MKRFLLKLALFVLLTVAIDGAIGNVYDYLWSHPRGSGLARLHYISFKTNADVLLFGSSRCLHHYDSCILEDSLGVSVYNCATSGQGILFFYVQLCNILNRYVPQMIVYDVYPDYDYLSDVDNTRFLGWARIYYGSPEIDSLFWKFEPSERLKMVSLSYRNNAQALTPWLSAFSNSIDTSVKGYVPLEGVIDYDVPSKAKIDEVVDSLKLEYLELFVMKCQKNNIKIVLMASPWYSKSEYSFSPIRTIAEKHHVPFIMHYQDADFVGHKELFKDSGHMNHVGATLYTQKIAGTVAGVLNDEQK
jgi:hypothetical protein